MQNTNFLTQNVIYNFIHLIGFVRVSLCIQVWSYKTEGVLSTFRFGILLVLAALDANWISTEVENCNIAGALLLFIKVIYALPIWPQLKFLFNKEIE